MKTILTFAGLLALYVALQPNPEWASFRDACMERHSQLAQAGDRGTVYTICAIEWKNR